MSTIRKTEEYRPNDSANKIMVGDLKDWMQEFPDDAEIEPVSETRGNQMDPYEVIVGYRVTWVEYR